MCKCRLFLLSFALIGIYLIIGENIKAKQGEQFFTNATGMKFILIPPGSFMMGSGISAKETGSHYGLSTQYYEGEHPQHRVTISRSFYFQTTEVTQGQWQKVMGNNPSHFKYYGENCPVESVSWHDTQEFIKRLKEIEGTDKYRLPTEAEWEYACRAGSSTRFCFGDDDQMLEEYAWYYNNSGGRTHPVSQKKPNAWGLYDMHGNVWEWCQDWYGPYPKGHVTDPKGPSSGKALVSRGGSWCYGVGHIRSAIRIKLNPNIHNTFGTFGFRVARDF
jgi:formylglycine-generating enzyme required for sulfatase activity